MYVLAQPLVALCFLIVLVILGHYMWIQLRVGQLRIAKGIKAPAITGDPEFERALRVQANSVEQFTVFLPSYLILVGVTALKGAEIFLWVAVALGVLYFIGRFLYARNYMADASKRAPGAMLTFAVNALIVLALFVQFLMYLL